MPWFLSFLLRLAAMQAIRTGKAYKRPIKTQLSDEALLGSSWVVIRGVSRVSIIVAHARGLIPP